MRSPEVREVELKVEVRSPLNREKGSVNVEKVLLLTTLSTVSLTPVPPNIELIFMACSISNTLNDPVWTREKH